MQSTTHRPMTSAILRFLRQPAVQWCLALVGLFGLMQGFTRHSIWLGLWGLTNDLDGISPFFATDLPYTTFIMFFHMITGGLMLVLATLQVVGPLRRRYRRFHRWSGRVTVGLGVVTATGALIYVARHGTTGGAFMNASSTLYGVMMLVAAVQTLRTGQRRAWLDHRRWGMRLTVLALASWLYRLHYTIWHAVFGDLWVTPDMRGPFDVFQAWGFFLGYAAMLEIWFLWEKHRSRRAR
ncbi:DUF2306 domain-containing protein [Roseobacter sp.]|uniref:DUF2306 domain-containing protein n=1 Tax=Roseobacter sp. TaxID=1907202 RepID=UPI0032984D8A